MLFLAVELWLIVSSVGATTRITRVGRTIGVGTYPSSQRRSIAASASHSGRTIGVGTYPSSQRRSIAASASHSGRTIGVGGCLAYGIFSQSETLLPGLQQGGSSKEITGSLRGGR